MKKLKKANQYFRSSMYFVVDLDVSSNPPLLKVVIIAEEGKNVKPIEGPVLAGLVKKMTVRAGCQLWHLLCPLFLSQAVN